MQKTEYARYLASREWALLREKVRKRSRGKCERCLLGDHESTHHLTYENVGHESLEELQGLCSSCHEFLSGKSDADPAVKAMKRVIWSSRQVAYALFLLESAHIVLRELYGDSDQVEHLAKVIAEYKETKRVLGEFREKLFVTISARDDNLAHILAHIERGFA